MLQWYSFCAKKGYLRITQVMRKGKKLYVETNQIFECNNVSKCCKLHTTTRMSC